MAPQDELDARRRQLDPLSHHITQEAGTEPPGTGKWLHNKQTGTYHCIVCDALLYKSDDKYDSKSGWPSFTRAAEEGAVTEHQDTSHGMTRTEIRCAQCNAHLGHVFDDGPEPTGQRHCTNSAAMDFKAR
jgi:peptide-methionine (R)-S-oxide reductase